MYPSPIVCHRGSEDEGGIAPSTLLAVPPHSSTSFPHFAHPAASTLLPRCGFLATGCGDGVVLLWDLAPACHRLSHPAGAVLCALRGSFDGKHVLAPTTWTTHPEAVGPRVIGVTTVEALALGSPLGTGDAGTPYDQLSCCYKQAPSSCGCCWPCAVES